MDFQQQANAFDAIGSEYDKAFNDRSLQISMSLRLHQQLPPASRILDAGCGTGVPTAALMDEKGHHVTGIDISGAMLDIAQRNAPSGRFLRMNMLDPEILRYGPSNAVTAFFALVLLTRVQMRDALSLWHKAMTSDGYLVIGMVEGDFDDLELPFLGQKVFASAYPDQDFRTLLAETGWRVTAFEKQDHPAAGPDTPAEMHLYYVCRPVD